MRSAKFVLLLGEARDSARKRYHKLGLFTSGLGKATAVCRNQNCDAYVQVIEKPLPNEIQIGGTAVAVNCPYQEERK